MSRKQKCIDFFKSAFEAVSAFMWFPALISIIALSLPKTTQKTRIVAFLITLPFTLAASAVTIPLGLVADAVICVAAGLSIPVAALIDVLDKTGTVKQGMTCGNNVIPVGGTDKFISQELRKTSEKTLTPANDTNISAVDKTQTQIAPASTPGQLVQVSDNAKQDFVDVPLEEKRIAAPFKS